MLRRESSSSTELNIESLPVPVEFSDCRQEIVLDDQNAVYVKLIFFLCILHCCYQIKNNKYDNVLTGCLKKIRVHIKLHSMMI